MLLVRTSTLVVLAYTIACGTARDAPVGPPAVIADASASSPLALGPPPTLSATVAAVRWVDHESHPCPAPGDDELRPLLAELRRHLVGMGFDASAVEAPDSVTSCDVADGVLVRFHNDAEDARPRSPAARLLASVYPGRDVGDGDSPDAFLFWVRPGHAPRYVGYHEFGPFVDFDGDGRAELAVVADSETERAAAVWFGGQPPRVASARPYFLDVGAAGAFAMVAGEVAWLESADAAWQPLRSQAITFAPAAVARRPDLLERSGLAAPAPAHAAPQLALHDSPATRACPEDDVDQRSLAYARISRSVAAAIVAGGDERFLDGPIEVTPGCAAPPGVLVQVRYLTGTLRCASRLACAVTRADLVTQEFWFIEYPGGGVPATHLLATRTGTTDGNETEGAAQLQAQAYACDLDRDHHADACFALDIIDPLVDPQRAGANYQRYRGYTIHGAVVPTASGGPRLVAAASAPALAARFKDASQPAGDSP